jgi:transcriptional regulator with XRE-family HTH domain
MHNQPNMIDVAVGLRICERRKELAITQSALADKLGMSLLQFWRAERGLVKIGASRLQRIAEILNVPVMFFFRSASEDLVPLRQMWESFQSGEEHATLSAQASSIFEDRRKQSKHDSET